MRSQRELRRGWLGLTRLSDGHPDPSKRGNSMRVRHGIDRMMRKTETGRFGPGLSALTAAGEPARVVGLQLLGPALRIQLAAHQRPAVRGSRVPRCTAGRGVASDIETAVAVPPRYTVSRPGAWLAANREPWVGRPLNDRPACDSPSVTNDDRPDSTCEHSGVTEFSTVESEMRPLVRPMMRAVLGAGMRGASDAAQSALT